MGQIENRNTNVEIPRLLALKQKQITAVDLQDGDASISSYCAVAQAVA